MMGMSFASRNWSKLLNFTRLSPFHANAHKSFTLFCISGSRDSVAVRFDALVVVVVLVFVPGVVGMSEGIEPEEERGCERLSSHSAILFFFSFSTTIETEGSSSRVASTSCSLSPPSFSLLDLSLAFLFFGYSVGTHSQNLPLTFRSIERVGQATWHTVHACLVQLLSLPEVLFPSNTTRRHHQTQTSQQPRSSRQTRSLSSTLLVRQWTTVKVPVKLHTTSQEQTLSILKPD